MSDSSIHTIMGFYAAMASKEDILDEMEAGIAKARAGDDDHLMMYSMIFMHKKNAERNGLKGHMQDIDDARKAHEIIDRMKATS